MYKSGLYQLGAGINQLGGSNYSLLGYPVGYYTNTGLTDMNEKVSRPILSVNQYLGGSPLPMYNIGSGQEPFILDDIQGGYKKFKSFKKKDKVASMTKGTLRNTNMSAIKQYQRKNLREKMSALKYPSLFNKDKVSSMTKGTLRSNNNKHLQKMNELLADLEKHKNEEMSIDHIIKKYKPMLRGMGYKGKMSGAGFFDFLKDIPILGDIAGAIL